MKHVLLVEHAAHRAAGFLQSHKELQPDCILTIWQCYQCPHPPDGSYDGLILSGGPMMVDALRAGEYPFFTAESDLIQQMAQNNSPILGVCLGSQILCALFGGEVGPKQWVVGWHVIHLTPISQADPLFQGVSRTFCSFQYHRDHFLRLPTGAEVLGISANTEFEAFRCAEGRRIWGCVFHPEMDVYQLMELYDLQPDLFTRHNLSCTDLAPLSDGRRERRTILKNFFNIVAQND